MIKLNKIKTALLFVVALVSVLLLFGCLSTAPNWGNVSGLIVDTSYNPISRATVLIGSETAYSSSNGEYLVERMTSGTNVVTLSKSGYTTSYRQVETGLGETTHANLAILAELDSKVTVVDSSGGVVSNTSGSIQIDIPAGALSTSKQIQVTEVPLIAAPYPPPTGYQFIAVIVYVTPTQTELASNATLSIPNSTGLVDGTDVTFYHFDLATLEWQLISYSSGEAHLSSGNITANIRDFGWLAAIIPISPSAGHIAGTITNLASDEAIPYANVWGSYFATVADENGAYTLSNLPTGEVTVEAVASGYARNSSSVTVVAGETVTCNIVLEALTTGNVEGYVYDIANNTPISGARVVGPGGNETITDTDGSYTLYDVDAGSATIYAYANNYFYDYDTVTVYAGQIASLSLYLAATTEAATWSDDFETDKGWEISSAFEEVVWQRLEYTGLVKNTLAPTYVTLPDYSSTLGKLPQPYGGSYSYWYGQESTQTAQGCYIAVQKSGDDALSGGTSSTNYPYNYGYLVSPSIDITGFAYATLSFWTWWEVEGVNAATGYDQMKVQISTDGGTTYTDVALLNPFSDPNTSREAFRPYTSGGYDQTGEWVYHSFDLTQYVGNVIKIRFYFNTVDTLYNGFRGWMIDNFAVAPEAISYSRVSNFSVDKRPDRGVVPVEERRK